MGKWCCFVAKRRIVHCTWAQRRAWSLSWYVYRTTLEIHLLILILVGLNAMANHGYLPRNGKASIPQLIDGTQTVFGMNEVGVHHHRSDLTANVNSA